MAQNSEAIKRMTNQFEQHKNNFCMAKKTPKKAIHSKDTYETGRKCLQHIAQRANTPDI